MSNTPARFRSLKRIIANTAITNAPKTITINGLDCKITSSSGNTWINPLGVASATADSYLLPTGASIDLLVSNNLSLISDVAGSTVNILIYE